MTTIVKTYAFRYANDAPDGMAHIADPPASDEAAAQEIIRLAHDYALEHDLPYHIAFNKVLHSQRAKPLMRKYNEKCHEGLRTYDVRNCPGMSPEAEAVVDNAQQRINAEARRFMDMDPNLDYRGALQRVRKSFPSVWAAYLREADRWAGRT